MSVLDEEAYGDLDDFLERFGDAKPSLQQIKALQVGTDAWMPCMPMLQPCKMRNNVSRWLPRLLHQGLIILAGVHSACFLHCQAV